MKKKESRQYNPKKRYRKVGSGRKLNPQYAIRQKSNCQFSTREFLDDKFSTWEGKQL
jgi:hypothetical protein